SRILSRSSFLRIIRWFTPALSVSRASDAQTVTVEILDIHFADAPGAIGWRFLNDGTAGLVVFVQRVDVLDEDRDPCARTALPFLAEEDAHLVAKHAAERRRVAPVPFLLEPQFVDIVLDRRRYILDIEYRDRGLETVDLALLRIGTGGNQHLRNRC